MSVNAYDTYKLIEKIEERKAPMPFFTRKYFSSLMLFDTAEVHFDYVLGKRRMAPFVSPVVEGRVMSQQGSTMKSFRPAYVKPKFAVRPTEVLKRRPGESFGGSMSNAQRFQLSKTQGYIDQSEMIDNRIEWMCVELLKNGSLTIEGEDYPKAVVDFGRDANNTITLTGASLWSDVASTPFTSLEDANTQASSADFGAPVTDIYMNANTYKVLRNHADFKDLMDKNFRGSDDTTLRRGPLAIDPENDPMVVGTSGIFTFYIDSRQYEDEDGNMVPYFTDGEVLMTSGAIDGVSAFGAIMDNDEMRAVSKFPKEWKVQDPSATMIMTQSAPLPIAKRINGSVLMNVL